MNLNIKINDINYNLNENLNLIQACNYVNLDIPRFCYHEKLSIAGNCRMCLIEVKGTLKPVASCSFPITKNIEIKTNSQIVKKCREGVLEFLLLNHPLDCPICDQGGECDLQDQSLIYGSDRGRFYEFKRSVKNKNFGYLIKTIMTRCIHCTRCIRFIDEYIGNKYLGLIGRGNNIEISNFISKIIISDVSGNVIDLCPVGALTSKPYSFIARPWELLSYNSIDLNDATNVNIRIDVRDLTILRILPIFNNNIKENWISDLTRFSYDGLRNQRLIIPLERVYINKFVYRSWLFLLYKIKIYFRRKKKRIDFFLGDFIDIETSALLKKLINVWGYYSINSSFNFNNSNNDYRNFYILKNNIVENINESKIVVLVGLNLRIENPLLNLRIKNLLNKNLLKLFNVGYNYNYDYNYNNSFYELKRLIEGKSFINLFLLKKRSLLLFNNNVMNKNIFLLNIVKNYISKITKIFSLTSNLTSINIQELNIFNSINNFFDKTYKRYKKHNIRGFVSYFINSDVCTFKTFRFLSIYQGNFLVGSNEFLDKFNFLFPTANYVEKTANYINYFGYMQPSKFILFPHKSIRSDWKLIYIIFRLLLKRILRKFNKINKIKLIKLFLKTFNLKTNTVLDNQYNKIFKFFNKYKLLNNLFNNYFSSIFNINLIARSSINMIKCLKDFKYHHVNFN